MRKITIDTEKGTADLVAPKANGNAYTVDTEQFKVSEK